MKGYIAFCPHFHQPHFQLHKTREEVYKNSYKPWFELLEKAVRLNGFFINLHLSGPFLYWLRDQKPQIQDKLRQLISTKKIGIIGGFCDEAFMQLSSRADDVFFQMKEYADLTNEYLGVSATEWQGIHIAERECGEFLLNEVSKAADIIGATPLYYLDAETFFESYYADEKGTVDYCLKYFGFNDPVSKTTITNLPKEMLYYFLRDEIAGTTFYNVPIHSEYRYRLLKTNSITEEDNVRIAPKQYLDYIKKDLEKAQNMALTYGKNIEPMAVIFEDAEKFGQWSKNPAEDSKWLFEFFSLVDKDSELSFIGLKDYFDRCGFLDTYPARTSMSYPEWDNWMAKRGIRGVVFSDERLRSAITRLHFFEDKQMRFEKEILKFLAISEHSDIILRALFDSTERFTLIEKLIEQHYGKDASNQYRLINRTRNMLYQEDPKWASRHPNYGSAPYYDAIGFSYLEIAERILNNLIKKVGIHVDDININVFDWDKDGEDEVIIQTPLQTLSIDLKGGCVNYHYALADKLLDSDFCFKVLSDGISTVSSYHSVFRYAMPIVFTETDSSLQKTVNGEGGRQEQCRNSFRCDLFYLDNDQYEIICSLHDAKFRLLGVENKDGIVSIKCDTTKSVQKPNGNRSDITIVKEFLIDKSNITINLTAFFEADTKGNLFLVPQIVTSLTPSEEVGFKPFSKINFFKGEKELNLSIDSILNTCYNTYKSFEEKINWSGHAEYLYEIKTGNGDEFCNTMCFDIESNGIVNYLKIKPAVGSYYDGIVGFSQSQLGYDSSGIMAMPYVSLNEKTTRLSITLNWGFNKSKAKFQDSKEVVLVSY